MKARVTENAVVLEWGAADHATGYNVYRGDDAVQPINSSALTAPTFEQAGVAFGQEQCYRVRSIALVDGVSLEGEPSAPHCVTPRDEFPPAAPKGLAAVPTAGPNQPDLGCEYREGSGGVSGAARRRARRPADRDHTCAYSRNLLSRHDGQTGRRGTSMPSSPWTTRRRRTRARNPRAWKRRRDEIVHCQNCQDCQN